MGRDWNRMRYLVYDVQLLLHTSLSSLSTVQITVDSLTSMEIWSILFSKYMAGMYTRLPSTTSMRSSAVASQRRVMSALWIRYSERMLRTCSRSRRDCATCEESRETFKLQLAYLECLSIESCSSLEWSY